ncbi:MAG: DNA-binding response regulator [Oscillatoriales cyanobacterium]|nr:MAG: DNA-binding response regulator [Oscillatoriales cyanobacterium]
MRILLVEDEPDLGKAIDRTLKQEKYIVDWAQDGNEAWEYLDSHWTQYTLAIFDWLLPGLSGIELLRRLRAKHSFLPVLMLTAKDRMEDKVAGLDAGADDYLVKPFCGSRTAYHLNQSGTNQTISLTNKEFQLLEYLMKHPNQIVTTDQIRNQIWEASADTFSNVVAAQVRLLRRKLESVGCANLIETVHGVGYRMRS